MPGREHVLHLVLMRRKPGHQDKPANALAAGWSALRAVPGVEGIGVVPRAEGGNHDLALFAALTDLRSSEEFGADSLHMTFLREHFIPALSGFAGADLYVQTAPPSDFGSALCVLMKTTEGVYDWQIKAALNALLEQSGALALCAGAAVNVRQRYQGGGILFFAEPHGADEFARNHLDAVEASHWREITTELATVWGPAM